MNEDVVARAGAQIDAWIGFYTRGLPPSVVRDRRDEVLADVHDQVEWSRERRMPDSRIARALRVRALRGAPADLTWAVALTPPGRVLDRTLVCFVALLTVALIAVCVIALTREPPKSVEGGALAVVLAILMGVGALTLLARERTRWLAALWVIATAHVVLFDGIDYLADSTTVLRYVASAAPAWRSGVLVADLGIALLAVAAAVWWARPMPGRREGAN